MQHVGPQTFTRYYPVMTPRDTFQMQHVGPQTLTR